ncbi:hypothetical protein D3C84_722260 [compost metagenome]
MHRDFLLFQLDQQALRQRHYAGLGHVVVAHRRALHQGRHRRDVDDLALAALEQRQERLAALDHAHQVDRDLPVPVLQRQLVEETARGHAGVVDDHIDAAELFLAGLRQGSQLTVVAHVATPGETLATGRANQLQSLGEPRLVDIGERQTPALARPAQGDFTPQARTRAGNHHAILHMEVALFCALKEKTRRSVAKEIFSPTHHHAAE